MNVMRARDSFSQGQSCMLLPVIFK